MRRKKGHTRQVMIVILFLLAAAIVAVLYLRYMPSSKKKNLYEYYNTDGNNGAICILGEMTLPETGLIEGGVGYLPLGMVQERLNAGFYWNEDTAQIYYALPTGVDKWDSRGEAGGEVLSLDGEIYLSLGLVERYTDLDSFVYTEPDRIVMRDTFDNLSLVKTKEKAVVRYLAGIKADVLTQVPAGTDLVYLGKEGDWTFVSTWDGYKGYVKSRQLGSVQETSLPRSFTKPTTEFIKAQEPINLGFAMVSNPDANAVVLENMQAMSGVTVISPTWFSITSESGEISSLASADLVDEVHSRGMQVWALVDNFAEGVSTYETMRHSSSRERLIENLIRECLESGVDGLNVDFEGLTYDSAPHVVEFMRELSIRTHQEGLILSFDNPVPEGYTSHYQRAEQAEVVDYSIIMGYDEHFQGSEFAGSVASFPWVEQGIIDSIGEFPPERTVLAVPFYTRAWYEQGGVTYSQVIYMFEQNEIISLRSPEIYWNTDLHQYVATWSSDGTDYTMWMEEENSIRDKMGLIKKYDLAGVAFWRLGFENDEIWSVLREGLQ